MNLYNGKSYIHGILLVLSSIYLLSCGSNIQSQKANTNSFQGNETIQDKESELFKDSFGLEIIKKVASLKGRENICISPISIGMALGMCYNGAQGSTSTELQQLLIKNRNINDLNTKVKTYLDLLSDTSGKVTFEISNSIWIREGYPIEEDFINTNMKYYNAKVENLDFSIHSSVQIINNWVAKSTHNKIQNIVRPPLSPETIMLIINAIYFQGDWSKKFKPDNTKKDIFYTFDSSEVECQMMQQKGKFKYLENNLCRIIDLPYCRGKFSMTILLPLKGVELDSLIKSISIDDWNKWLAGLESKEIRLYLPKFKMEYKSKLNQLLIDMGIPSAFDPDRSDFSGINTELGDKIYIDEVLHKTYLKVDEKGTEAAAVTSARMSVTSAYPPTKPITMRIDHPFIYAIRDRDNGNLIFIGKVEKP